MSRTNQPAQARDGRGRQANRAKDHLAKLRARNEAQQQEALERERRVDRALLAYARAGARLDAAAGALERRVAELQERIERAQADHERDVRDDRLRQARAALDVHESGRTLAELAELLDVSERAASRLLRDARSSPRRAGDDSDAVAPGQRRGADLDTTRPSAALGEPAARRRADVVHAHTDSGAAQGARQVAPQMPNSTPSPPLAPPTTEA